MTAFFRDNDAVQAVQWFYNPPHSADWPPSVVDGDPVPAPDALARVAGLVVWQTRKSR